MTLRIITPPAVEPVTVAEVMTWSRIDASNQEPAPGAITVALAGLGAGNVNSGAHRYAATFVTATGETQAGTVSAAVTTTGGDGQVALSNIPLGGALVTSRKLYRTTAGGSTYLLLATLADNTTTTYSDNIADGSLGAGAPSVNTTSDPMLSMLITAARRVAERRTGRALITQTWEQVLDAFPTDAIRLGMMPIQSVTSLQYFDSSYVLQTVASENYVLDADTQPGWLLLALNASWPTAGDVANSVIARFVAGYGASGSDVPSDIRMWISAQVKAAFDNPSGLMDGKAADLPFIDAVLESYRVSWL
jgi:uncharacterized phiE125 gp8 family phage protein